MVPVIDMHTHHYPPEVRRDPAGWAARQGEPHWAQLVTGGPQGWASDETFLEAMEAAAVGLAVLQGWYWERIETCRWQNRFYAACRRARPERWQVFASLQPAAGWEANHDLLEEAREAGFVGIGELHAAAQGFSLRDPAWLQICSWAEDHQWPISLHVTEPAGHDYLGRLDAPLMDYVWLAEQFPRVRFVFAHWGGGLPFYTLNRRVGRALAQCFFDTAASPLLYRPAIWRTVRDLVGPEHILFGTDFPLLLRPRKQPTPSIAVLREELEEAGLNPEETRAILGGNAERLLSPPRPSPLPSP